MKPRWINAIILALFSGLIISTFYLIGLFQSLELKTLDLRFRYFAKPEKASREIVLVAIDDKSLIEFKRNGIMWKWPRDFYAILTDYLRKGGAKLIIYDILFNDSDIDRLSTDAEETDGKFANEMKKANNVILAVHLNKTDDFLFNDNPLKVNSNILLKPPESKDKIQSYSNAVLPIPMFQASAMSLGVVNYKEDPDGICRRIPLLYSFQGEVIPQIAFSAWLAIQNVNEITVEEKKFYKVNDVTIPTDGDGNYLISWYGKGGPNGCFKYYSIASLIASAVDEEFKRKPLVPSGEFKDKIVIIGATAPGLFDYKNTPFTSEQPYPAMEIYATILSNLLQRDFLLQTEAYFTIITIFMWSLIISFIITYIHRIWISISLTIICSIIWLGVALYFFYYKNTLFEIVAPESAIFFSFASSAIVSYQLEGKARRQLHKMFNRYLSPILVKEVLEKSDRIKLDGKEVLGTVFFSGVKDFASIHEKLSPQELVALLNEYFSLATDVILKYEGLLDKYLGDAMIAIYGAPLTHDNHAIQACNSALEIHNIIKNHWEKKSNNCPIFETRIGINTGKMVVGNIGSRHRLDYTAIGGTVNLASHLVGMNRIFGTNIIISESTFSIVKDKFVTRELDTIRVKGKNQTVVIYELVGKPSEVSQSIISKIERFNEGLFEYHRDNFQNAANIFESILTDTQYQDLPSQVYLNRCKKLLLHPPFN